MAKSEFIWAEIQKVVGYCEAGYELGFHKMWVPLDYLRRSPIYTLLHEVTDYGLQGQLRVKIILCEVKFLLTKVPCTLV